MELDIALMVGDTLRSRCYLQALCAAQLAPCYVVLLPSNQNSPGQAFNVQQSVECQWGIFHSAETVVETASTASLRLLHAPTPDINSAENIKFLKELDVGVFIYSGFGGVILSKAVLSCGKRFLHIHGGWLPEYKGSTTNHYSVMKENFCGASAIFLNESIDGGDILLRKKFPPPRDLSQLDYIFDPLYRADVLLDVLHYYKRFRIWPNANVKNETTEHYYIMHPVLRHILIVNNHR